jgi:uncharacterized protein YggE
MLQKASHLFTTIFVILFVFTAQKSFADEKQTSIISLTGTGNVSIAPDMAVISFGVVKEAKTARAALDENNKAMASILKAMEDKGIDKKDLQTSGFNIQPKYFYPKRKSNGEQPAPEITGYRVANNITIRIREIENAGEILDLSVTLGINSGGNIQFTNSDTTAVLKEARIKAVEDALEKAQTLAQAAGVELGDILNISENTSRPRPVGIAQARSLRVQEDAAVPIASGENNYSVTVQMSWEISQ